MLHGATANLTPTVLPPYKASNPTASQHQHLLQLLRDCYMVLLQTLLLLYFHHAKLQILLLLSNQHLLQLLRDYLHPPCATANLTPTVLPPYKASNPTASRTLLILYLPLIQRAYMVLTSKPYSYCTSTIQSFKSYLANSVLNTVLTTHTEIAYMVLLQTLLLLYFHHAKLQILLLLRTNNYYNS